jgi:hypothetical protein
LSHRRVALLATLVAAVVGLGLTGTALAGTAPGEGLPPVKRGAIAKLFDDKLRELGYRTTRASLVRHRIYGAPTNGPHLAIYVEPIDPAGLSARDSVDNIVPIAQLFLPKVFKRWSDLASFDVCQEPATTVDDSPTPPPITQIAVTRKASKGIDWQDVSLEDLVARAARVHAGEEYGLGDTRHLYLYVGPEVADAAAYRQARTAAGLSATVTTTTTSTLPTG